MNLVAQAVLSQLDPFIFTFKALFSLLLKIPATS